MRVYVSPCSLHIDINSLRLSMPHFCKFDCIVSIFDVNKSFVLLIDAIKNLYLLQNDGLENKSEKEFRIKIFQM